MRGAAPDLASHRGDRMDIHHGQNQSMEHGEHLSVFDTPIRDNTPQKSQPKS
jgi:hypothetical protein